MRKLSILVVLSFFLLLGFLSRPKTAFAGCEYAGHFGDCSGCGGECGGGCRREGNTVIDQFVCCNGGAKCGFEKWFCDTQGARDMCPPGGGCSNTTCGPNYSCGGGGPGGHGCQAQQDVNCYLRGTKVSETQCKSGDGRDCEWRQVPNESWGSCEGYVCKPNGYCRDFQYNGGVLCGECEVITTNYCCNYSDPTSPNYVQGNGYCSGNPSGTCQYNDCGAQTTTCSVCANTAPGPVSLSSPNDGATSIPTTTVVQAAYNAATFNWGRNCSGNTNTFRFYLDTSTNPTTLKCTNTASPPNSTNISPGCQVSGLSYSTRYYWKVVVSNGNQSATSPTWSFETLNPNPWWQVKDADVVTNGNLISSIPPSCILPGCNPVFDIAPTGGYPGVPSYTGSYDFNAEVGTGNVSTYPIGTVGWNALTPTTFKKVYDYTFFKNQIPSDISLTWTEINQTNFSCTPGAPSCTINGGDFNSRGNPSPSHGGYVWFHFDGSTYGDLIISGNANIVGSRKAVLLVEGANLNINGKINIQTKGSGFFMAVVGKTALGQKGNITVDPTISSPNSAAIEGIYFADGNVSTGAGNNWLYVRGAIAAMGGITLQRNLTNNSAQPAEYFEYAPDLALLYPGVFKTRPIKWKEVAP